MDDGSLPQNIHLSHHPCLLAKLSQLRSKDTLAKDVKTLIHEITMIIGCEALASTLQAVPGTSGVSPLGFEYRTTEVQPQAISLVPILRSGLSMVDGLQALLPISVPVHHLGLFREPTTLEPVEYYNNLPVDAPAAAASSSVGGVSTGGTTGGSEPSSLAIVLDPVIATGGTCAAAIQTLREWGAGRVVVLSVLGAVPGLRRAAAEWPEGVEIWVAGVDAELTDSGMLKPGLGDVGDRLFLTLGK